MNDIFIQTASKTEAEEILALQKLAYISEAEIINDFSIPPLKQTLEEVLSEFDSQIVLKAVQNSRIIGSVRAFLKENTCCIGKLIVHPDAQNKGIGSRLLLEAEKRFPDAFRFELFTGEKSEKNLYIYKKHGYQVFKKQQVSDKLTLLFLEKINEKPVA